MQIPAEMIHYGMTKTAQIAIARGVAETAAGTGSRSTRCCPVRPNQRAWRQFVADLARQRGIDRSVVEAEFFKTGRPIRF